MQRTEVTDARWASFDDLPEIVVRRLTCCESVRDILQKVALGRLGRIFGRFIYKVTSGKPIGRDGRIRVSAFLDLLSAAHNDAFADELADVLAARIRHTVDLREYAGVVGPKRGNALFVKAVADRLKLRSSFIRANILFGRWIEGECTSGDKVILVDDVASDGELLYEAVENLRRAGVYVDTTFVLVDRREGDAEEQLNANGVKYVYCIQLNDGELCGIRRQER